ncbi:MAG: metallophosphoesterase, partial [candidate division WOR-3 bacterium]
MRKQFSVLLTAAIAAGALHADAVRFAVLGDRTGSHVEGIYGQVVAEVEALKPEFVITVGDQIEGYTEDTARMKAQWQEFDSIVASLSMPLYVVPGNHDITNDAMEPLFELYTGRNPFYSFDHKGVHVVVLDNSRCESSQGFPEEQFEWLKQDLAASREADHTLVFFHKPFWYERAAHGRPDPLHELFKEHGVDAVFSGHYHEYFSGELDGITYTAIGSSGGDTEPGPTGIEYLYATVTVDDKGVAVQPILLGGETRPSDEVTISNMLAIENVHLTGMRTLQPVLVAEGPVTEAVVSLEIANATPGVALDDTLRWELPEAWTVDPMEQPVRVEAEGVERLEFSVKCTGDPFPVPEASLEFPYAEGRTVEVTGLLHVARTASCPLLDEAPVVDGQVAEPGWGEPVTRFFDQEGGEAKTDPVEFYFGRDDENLYLAAVCRDEKPDSIVARAEEQDGAVYTED